MDEWDQVIAEHGGMVWGTVYRVLGDRGDAADCYQEVFAAAVVVAGRERVRNWGGLLRRLALVQAWKRVKGRVREREEMEAGLEGVASLEREPWEAAATGELVVWLRGVLGRMPGEQGAAFWMVCVEGMGHAEAGEALGLEANHVGVLVHRARGRLRELAGVWMSERKG